MIENLFQTRRHDKAECDICVVGAGAAGITLAAALDGKGLRVLLLEAGGFSIDPGDQALFTGEAIGEPIAIQEGRFRVFGGATKHWTGRCAELDPLDFQLRNWVPWSGWPIALEDLKPYYRRAQSVCGFTRPWESDDKLSSARRAAQEFRLEGLRYFVWRYAATGWRVYQDWGGRYRRQLERSGQVQVLIGASLVGLRGQGDRIATAQARQPDGSVIEIVADQFVLCCGGLENVRLLLNFSRDPHSAVSDPYGVVGRWFMQHPRAITATGKPTPRGAALFALKTVRRGRHSELGFAVTAELQAREAILNVSAILRFIPDPKSGWELVKRQVRGLAPWTIGAPVARDACVIGQNMLRRLIGRGARLTNPTVQLILDLEQAPDPDSRITLGGELDAFGLRKLRVDWRIGEAERRTSRVMTRKVIDETRRLGLADLSECDDLDLTGGLSRNSMLESYHHLGGTRMSVDPSRGVVNRNLRVHGLRNLYVAGGSVLPTGGHANPTFTIVALALRLADALIAATTATSQKADYLRHTRWGATKILARGVP